MRWPAGLEQDSQRPPDNSSGGRRQHLPDWVESVPNPWVPDCSPRSPSRCLPALGGHSLPHLSPCVDVSEVRFRVRSSALSRGIGLYRVL